MSEPSFQFYLGSIIKSLYASIILLVFVTGAQFFLYIYGLLTFWDRPPQFQRSKRLQLAISLFILLSFALVAILRSYDAGLLFTRSSEADLIKWANSTNAWWVNADAVAVVAIQLTGEGILLYRCYIIWGTRKSIILLPSALYLATIAIGLTATIRDIALDENEFDVQYTISKFWAPYYLLTAVGNSVVTSLIALPLIRMRSRMAALSKLQTTTTGGDAGPDNTDQLPRFDFESVHAKTYTSILSILVESALPFTLIGIGSAIASYLMSSPSFAIVGLSIPIVEVVWVSACALAAQLIIFRVITGSTWTTSPTTIDSGSGRPGPLTFAENGRSLETRHLHHLYPQLQHEERATPTN